MLLSYDDVAKALAAAGVPAVLERSVAGAVATAGELGIPLVVKVVSPALAHKADVGAVELDVRGHDAAGRLAELAGNLALGRRGVADPRPGDGAARRGRGLRRAQTRSGLRTGHRGGRRWNAGRAAGLPELARRGLAAPRPAGIPLSGDPARALKAVSFVNGTGARR
ncbi:ATP-grasp domain-containing protein [Amycolatopsis australiensis]|uniref:ATP-grasp domain-containing protein n=2 Tax=Amycolatopsis australiensis TaxID=546364 RepID=A0A1K1SWC2_9PSEU|nr:ATP-grasp domain-containing protein [Amycolatopsis australiensis]